MFIKNELYLCISKNKAEPFGSALFYLSNYGLQVLVFIAEGSLFLICYFSASQRGSGLGIRRQ